MNEHDTTPAAEPRGFLRDTLTLALSQFLIMIAAIGTAIVTSRTLGAEGRGLYTVALLIPALLSTLLDLGIGAASVRAVASREWAARTVFGSQLLLTLAHAAAAIAGAAVLARFAGDWIAPGVRLPLLLLGVGTLPPLLSAGYLLPILLGLHRARVYGGLLAFSTLASFLALLTAFWTVGLTVERALWLQVITGGVVSVAIAARVWMDVGGPARPSLRYIRYAYRFGLGAYAASLLRFADMRLLLLLLNAQFGPEAVGYFTLATSLTERTYVVADAVGTALFPRISRDAAAGQRRTTTVFRLVVATAIAAGIALTLLAGPLIQLLFGAAFAPAAAPIALLSAGVVLASGWRVLSSDLLGRGVPWVTAGVNGLAATVTLGMTALLAPRLGLQGAAAAVLLGAATAFVAGALAFRWRAGVRLTALATPSPEEVALASALVRAPLYLAWLGPRYARHLLRAYAWDSLAYRWARAFAVVQRRAAYAWDRWRLTARLRQIRRRESAIAARGRPVPLAGLRLPPAAEAEVGARLAAGEDVFIGDFDHYGRLLPAIAPVEGIEAVAADEFVPRERGAVRLWLTPRGALVEKRYGGPDAAHRFWSELRALERLHDAPIAVPRLIAADVAGLTLRVSYLPGENAEHILARAGAALTGPAIREVIGEDATARAVDEAYREHGRALAQDLPPQIHARLHALVREIHRHGVEVYDVKYGNVLIERNGNPALIDFDAARVYSRPRSRRFLIERDRDIERINRAWGTEFLTRARLRTRLDHGDFPAARLVYGSAYIGHGLRFGRVWDPSIGIGRWLLVLRRRLGVLRDARVLSLGANSGTVELAMMRAGVAHEVVAYEQDPRYVAQGEFLREAFEWADNRAYPIEFITADMREAAARSDRFDVVLGLCSLYYLEAGEMRQLVASAARLADHVVLQCNVRRGIGRTDADEYERASVAFARASLTDAGLRRIRVSGPPGYSRPLVEGWPR